MHIGKCVDTNIRNNKHIERKHRINSMRKEVFL